MGTIHVDLGGTAAEEQPMVPSVSIQNLVRQRDGALDRFQRAIELLREANEIAQHAHLGEQRVILEEFGRHEVLLTGSGREALQRSLDAKGWQYLMQESGLRTFMDAKARREWDDNIIRGTIPELTTENIAATFQAIHASRGELFERGVIEIYRRLSWEYKTNNPVKFGKRLVITHLYSVHNSDPKRYCAFLNHSTTDELDDLVRVFCVLDGVPQPDHRQGVYHCVREAETAQRTELDHTYFAMRWYRKGTAHVAFKRLDLVDRMNHILAKHYPNALPQSQ